MNNILSPSQGVVFLILYGLVIIGITTWFGRGHKKDQSELFLSNQGIGVLPGALSISASKIWHQHNLLPHKKLMNRTLQEFFGLQSRMY